MAASIAYLKIEVQAHSALAMVGRIQGALAEAGTVVGSCFTLPYLTFRVWRHLRTLARLIQAGPDSVPSPPKIMSDEEMQHVISLLRELYERLSKACNGARSYLLIRVLYGPMLPAIERDTEILGLFLADAEMKLSAEFQAGLRQAIAELNPPTGVDWRKSLETMRH